MTRVISKIKVVLNPIVILTYTSLIFHLIVGVARLNPSNINWIAAAQDVDFWAGYLSWEQFRKTPWGLPLGENPRVGEELSGSIIHSGGIPLFEIPLKGINAVLPETFQYFGIWTLFCFVGQAVAGWKISGLVFKSSVLRHMVAIAFLFSPIFLNRVNWHQGLIAQFLILIGIYLVFRKDRRVPFLYWGALLVCSFFVHGYIAVMVTLIFLTSILDALIKKRLSIEDFTKGLLGCIPGVLISLWISGYFMISQTGLNSGWPNWLWKMDLLQPFNFAGWSHSLSWLQESQVGNLEGFAYLGVWPIALILVSLAINRGLLNLILENVRNSPSLAILLFALFLYSLSNKITLGRKEINYQIPSFIEGYYGIFRASGRFFWPIYYMIIVAALYLLKNSIKERYAIVLFGILLIFHIVDTEKYWGNISMINYEKKIDKKFVGLKDSRWDELLDSRKAILVIPITSQLPRIPSCPIFEKIGYLAMRKNISTNCVYLSRYDSNKVQESKLSLELSLEGGTLKVDSLYILTQQDIERFKSDFLKNGVAYEYVDGLWVAYKD
jgi:hypothetical protein